MVSPSSVPADITRSWQQGALLDLTIASLSNSGEGVGRWGDRVVFVPDVVPGDRVRVRLVRVKPNIAFGKLHDLIEPSPHRIRPGCIVADKCGGCQWQPVAYAQQLVEKRNNVIQSLVRIGGFADPPVNPVLPSEPLGYRNKVTYPLGRSPATGTLQVGYYQKGSHKLVNLNQCPVQDPRLNPLLAEIKLDLQRQGWPIYDEKTQTGQLRHLSLRIGRRTGEILLTLVSRSADLPNLATQAHEWLSRYPGLVGVALNLNPSRTNAIFGHETRCIAGQPYLHERFAGLTFQIRSTTFFQVNTEQAEALLTVILDELNLQGHEVILDAYSGIGTLTLPLANRANRAIAIESSEESVEQARLNAALNGIENVTIYAGATEQLLPQIPNLQPDAANLDVVVLDPPRKGCDPAVIDALRDLQPKRIVYMSCNPATLARDLKQLCHAGDYRLMRVQPADFFPQTAHVECAAFLVR